MAEVPQLWTGKKRDLMLLAGRLLVDDPRRARDVAGELCELDEADGDIDGIIGALFIMAQAARGERDFALARALLERATDLRPTTFVCALRAMIDEDAATRCNATRDREGFLFFCHAALEWRERAAELSTDEEYRALHQQRVDELRAEIRSATMRVVR